jgi:hypothetical protein
LNIIAIVKDVDSKEENKKMTMKTPWTTNNQLMCLQTMMKSCNQPQGMWEIMFNRRGRRGQNSK